MTLDINLTRLGIAFLGSSPQEKDENLRIDVKLVPTLDISLSGPKNLMPPNLSISEHGNHIMPFLGSVPVLRKKDEHQRIDVNSFQNVFPWVDT